MTKQSNASGTSRSPESRSPGQRRRRPRRGRRRRQRLLRFVVAAMLILFLTFCAFAAVHAVRFLCGITSAAISGLSRPTAPSAAGAAGQPQGIRGNYTKDTAATSTGNQTAADICISGSFLDRALDIKLEEILTPGGDARRQVKDIYFWARTGLTYGPPAGTPDLAQAAEDMLLTGCGDCYSYYAVTKLMFDKLGIPNSCVQKQQTDDDSSEHYWSLVSTDGGRTWYHFDATPRVGEGDDFCLVTDAFLDAYSEGHQDSHRRDKSLYPATP